MLYVAQKERKKEEKKKKNWKLQLSFDKDVGACESKEGGSRQLDLVGRVGRVAGMGWWGEGVRREVILTLVF